MHHQDIKSHRCLEELCGRRKAFCSYDSIKKQNIGLRQGCYLIVKYLYFFLLLIHSRRICFFRLNTYTIQVNELATVFNFGPAFSFSSLPMKYLNFNEN